MDSVRKHAERPRFAFSLEKVILLAPARFRSVDLH